MAEIPNMAAAEAAIVEQTNAFRRSEGRTAVVRNVVLDQAARRFAEYLARTGRFAHEADGRQPADRATAAGYRYCTIAENLALNLDSRGFSTAKLAGEAVEGWKASPGHRKNMLLPNVTEIGVGIARAPGADPKFHSVQLFGRPQRLSFTFQVQNSSGTAVTYSFGGKTQQIEPRVVVTHTACEPGAIRFVKPGGWFGGAGLDVTFDALDRAKFVLRGNPDGRLTVSQER